MCGFGLFIVEGRSVVIAVVVSLVFLFVGVCGLVRSFYIVFGSRILGESFVELFVIGKVF